MSAIDVVRPSGATLPHSGSVIVDGRGAVNPLAPGVWRSTAAAALPAVPVVPAEWSRSYARERREGTTAVRGLVFGILFSLPVWGLLIAGGSMLVDAIS